MILLYGRPASGKSDLRVRLAEATGRPHVSVDDKRANTTTAKAAQAQLILDARRKPDIIIECCHPHPVLLELAQLTVLVHASDQRIRQRLTARGWSQGHIGRALRERYPVNPDLTCQTADPEQVRAVIARVGALPTEQPVKT